jgi:glycosyltransferase involved in cell wall biosynthesis
VKSCTESTATRVLVVGAGTHFLSAMSYYTIRLTNALAGRFSVAIIPMRRLIPTSLYPGGSRVGSTTTQLDYDPAVKVLQGIDWYWIPNLFRTLNSLRKWKPDVVIFEWWTGAVLHTYLTIALVARLLGASVIVEMHEVAGGGEEQVPFARAWVSVLGRPFFRLASAFVIHSEADRVPIEDRYRLRARPCFVIPIGPMDHHASRQAIDGSAPVARSSPPPDTLNLLFFGLIRPYKGLEDLVQAFDSLDDEEVKRYWLTVVGETWEGWDLPIRLIQSSRHRARITLVNRFVDDDEVIAHFAAADAVVLPYHRSSASSPAQVAMSNGLPLVITAVGGLPAAVADYEGAILVPPSNPRALRDAILYRLPGSCGRRYKDPHSWDRSVRLYDELIEQLTLSDGSVDRTRQAHAWTPSGALEDRCRRSHSLSIHGWDSASNCGQTRACDEHDSQVD